MSELRKVCSEQQTESEGPAGFVETAALPALEERQVAEQAAVDLVAGNARSSGTCMKQYLLYEHVSSLAPIAQEWRPLVPLEPEYSPVVEDQEQMQCSKLTGTAYSGS